MCRSEGRVSEVVLDPSGKFSVQIVCPGSAIPRPGQYILAWSPSDRDSALAAALFPARIQKDGFLTAPSVPKSWEPGTLLELRGPSGKGFNTPNTIQHLLLTALGGTVDRLLPLIDHALTNKIAVTLFTDSSIPALPTAVEIYPLSDLPAALPWADFICIDLPLEKLCSLRGILGLAPDSGLPCEAEALITTAMPCGGPAECSVCAVPVHRKWKLACKEGPVFDLQDINW